MSTLNLHRLFNPKSVAVIGAIEKKDSVGFSIMNNLLKSGFKGEITPANHKHKSIMGRPSVDSVRDIESSVDMAVIETPINTVPEIVDSCGKAGLAGAVIISSGGKEIGTASAEPFTYQADD
jgi:acetyltransferase